jgi:hypothetical protein
MSSMLLQSVPITRMRQNDLLSRHRHAERNLAAILHSIVKRLRRAPNPDDELAKYKGITDPPESQDPLDWWILH